MTVTTTNTGTGTATGNICLAPGFTDAGAYSATVRVSDGSLNDSKSFTINVCNACGRPPVINPVADMTVVEGGTVDQMVTGSDADGDALTFFKSSGPIFMTVSTTNPTTGNVHLAPGFADAGTYSAAVGATDGTLSAARTFTITALTSGNRCPVANAGGLIKAATRLDVVNNGSFTAARVSPNPLNPEATLTFTASRQGAVRIDLFNIQGRLVRRLVDESALAAGIHDVTIDGRGGHAEKLPSGVYYIRGTSAEGEFKRLITILK